jgi:hypothetical protein
MNRMSKIGCSVGALAAAVILVGGGATRTTAATTEPASCLSVEFATVAAMTEDDAPAEVLVRQPGKEPWALPLRAFEVSAVDAEGNALEATMVYAACS